MKVVASIWERSVTQRDSAKCWRERLIGWTYFGWGRDVEYDVVLNGGWGRIGDQCCSNKQGQRSNYRLILNYWFLSRSGPPNISQRQEPGTMLQAGFHRWLRTSTDVNEYQTPDWWMRIRNYKGDNMETPICSKPKTMKPPSLSIAKMLEDVVVDPRGSRERRRKVVGQGSAMQYNELKAERQTLRQTKQCNGDD